MKHGKVLAVTGVVAALGLGTLAWFNYMSQPKLLTEFSNQEISRM